MDELCCVIKILSCQEPQTNIENIILHYFVLYKINSWNNMSNMSLLLHPAGAAPHITINMSNKCKPVDSQTRQEVKANEQKNNRECKVAGEWICKNILRSLFNINIIIQACHVLSYNSKSLIWHKTSSQASYFLFFSCAELTIRILHIMLKQLK